MIKGTTFNSIVYNGLSYSIGSNFYFVKMYSSSYLQICLQQFRWWWCRRTKNWNQYWQLNYYRLPKKLLEGNAFNGVCRSVWGRGSGVPCTGSQPHPLYKTGSLPLYRALPPSARPCPLPPSHAGPYPSVQGPGPSVDSTLPLDVFKLVQLRPHCTVTPPPYIQTYLHSTEMPSYSNCSEIPACLERILISIWW